MNRTTRYFRRFLGVAACVLACATSAYALLPGHPMMFQLPGAPVPDNPKLTPAPRPIAPKPAPAPLPAKPAPSEISPSPKPNAPSPGLSPRGASSSGLFLMGRWEGRAELGDGEEDMIIRLFPADPEAESPAGGLVEMPSRGLFGYPMGELFRSSEGLAFDLAEGAPLRGRFEFRGAPADAAPGEPYTIAGTLRIIRPDSSDPSGEAIAAEGGFTLAYSRGSSRGQGLGSDYPIDTGKALIPASLLMPELAEGGSVPVVLLIPPSHADRDGNNYSVPGRSDCLAQLAQSLKAVGIASLRYDRRGAGEAYRLVGGAGPDGVTSAEPTIDEDIHDAKAAIASLASAERFSSVLVVAYADAALVASLAVDAFVAGAEGGADGVGDANLAATRGRLSGLVALCSSGRNESELLEDYLATVPAELQSEAASIMAALKEGKTFPNPSPYFASYFGPSLQPYLISLFAHDIRTAFANLPCRALVVAGARDLQVGSEGELLVGAKPDAAYRVIPGMSHALKAVGDDEELNYASFTDPSLPLADGLAESISAFAKGE